MNMFMECVCVSVVQRDKILKTNNRLVMESNFGCKKDKGSEINL